MKPAITEINSHPTQTRGWLWPSLLLFVLLLSVICYLPAIPGMAVWDDHQLIGGAGIGGGDTLLHCFTEPFLHHYFRPLVSVSFFLEHRLSGSGPIFYHTTNILIHLITTGCLIGLTLSIFHNRGAALLAGLIFAVQPTQVSTVAWIGGRTDSMTTMWLSGFIWTLALAVRNTGVRRAGYLVGSCLLYFLALMTKEQVFSILPLIFLAVPCFREDKKPTTWKEVIRLSAPYMLVATLFVSLWFCFFPSPPHPELHSLSNQFKIGGNTILYYALLFLAPSAKWMHMLSIGELEKFGMASVLGGYSALLSLVAFLAYCCKKAKQSAWFVGYILLSALPILNLLPIPSIIVAPYRVGVTGLAVAILMGLGLARLASPILGKLFRPARVGDDVEAASAPVKPVVFNPLRVAGIFAGASLIVWMTFLTYNGAAVWQNESTVFAEFSRYDPDSAIARINYSSALIASNQPAKAADQIEKLLTLIFRSEKWRTKEEAVAALAADPSISERIREAEGNSIKPEMWLGNIFAQLGFTRLNKFGRDAAKSAFDTGYAIQRDNHNLNIGEAQIAFDDKDYPKAISYLRIAVATRSTHIEMYILLSRTYMRMGKWREAQMALANWTELQSWNGKAYVLMAAVQSRQGKYTEAKSSLEYALAHSICDKKDVKTRLADIKGTAAEIL